MSEEMIVQAELREEFGKNVARRFRHTGQIPAVVYGGGGPSIPIAVNSKEIVRILHSASGHNAIFTLQMKGKAPARVMLREWQVEPMRGTLLHVDMVRVTRATRLKLRVPIRITGEAKGVKLEGGILDFVLREVELECLPDDIPGHLAVDVSGLALGQNIRVSDLPVGPGVKVLTEPTRVIVHVVGTKEEEEKPTAEALEVAPTEPELIRKGKAEEEEGKEKAGEEK